MASKPFEKLLDEFEDSINLLWRRGSASDLQLHETRRNAVLLYVNSLEAAAGWANEDTCY